jgi:serine/threonine protein kinase
MLSDEVSRGIDYLRKTVESTRVLKLPEPHAVNQGNSFVFTVKAYGKEWNFSLSKEQLADLPQTKEYQSGSIALTNALTERFKNIDPNMFVTVGGRLLRIDIEWPPSQWYTPGGGIAAAVCVWVHINDVLTREVARCPVVITHQQTMPGLGVGPFSRAELIVNTVRSKVDNNEISFYPSQQELPKTTPYIRLETGPFTPQRPNVRRFIADKVWLLAFRAGNGNKHSSTWIADPWDATYLGTTEGDLRQAAVILEAREEISLNEDVPDFASVGKGLLASDGHGSKAKEEDAPVFRSALSSYASKRPLGEGGSGKVLLVTDHHGDEFALKYLKPSVQSQQKTQRFKNELAFCTKNTHPNIITIEDRGLAKIEGTEVPFFIMPVFSKTLRKVLKNQRSPEHLLMLFVDILNGIEHAHDSSIWHRDLKPENVLVTENEDRAVVTDFGIAHFDDENLYTLIQTEPADRLANFRYAAPEQRDKKAVDHRADIYALGLIVYEMFTEHLLQGTQHTRIGSLNPEYSFLDPIVESMTCQSPDDRLPSISLVREMLVANSPAELAQKLKDRFDHETKLITEPTTKKPPLAVARYEVRGTANRLQTFVRPHPEQDGVFTFETSNGEILHGNERQVADHFAQTDRRLQQEGFTRENWSNLSGKSLFNL